MSAQNDRLMVGALLVAILVVVAMLATPAPTVGAEDGSVLVTRATRTNTDPDKRVFARCPDGTKATGGGAQAFAKAFAGHLEPGQHGRISIFQVIPSRDLSGYGARAQAQAGFRHPWHLTVYAICR
jgi:hypothetical protein